MKDAWRPPAPHAPRPPYFLLGPAGARALPAPPAPELNEAGAGNTSAMAQQQVYPPNVIVRMIVDAFLPYRGLELSVRGLQRGAPVRQYSDDDIISDMSQFDYIRIDALRKTPRGKRDWVVILVLAAKGKYAAHTPDLRKLLQGVELERAAKEGRLDEIIVVAEEAFFGEKRLIEIIRELQKRSEGGGADREGKNSFTNAYPYSNFCINVPANINVPNHRLMADTEVDELLQRERLTTVSSLPSIRLSDPPVVWLGAREGQVVEITRASQTGGSAIVYRHVAGL